MNRTSLFRLLSHPVAICLLLALAILAIYSPVRNYGFVNYDDPAYFTDNPHVLGGLSWADTKWAFTTNWQANWHPLTWLSLMLDVQLFGKGATAPHIVNVLLHLANSILVFFLVRRWTATLWRSAAVAMLFAIHPMHVESVAWIAERKDVLSGLFGLLTLLCYTQYSQSGRAWSLSYGLALFFFVCGLMSKPMLVTLPFVMLLVDFWPLQRFHPSGPGRLLIEKIPFFLLCVIESIVTFVVQQKGGAVSTLAKIPLLLRIENTFVSYARYLAKIFFPFNLANPYPPPHYWPALVVLFSVVLFAALCFGAFALRKEFPWLFTGWFWFAGMLVPVIGLVQVGSQALADRYIYLPLIGILIVVVWGLAEICAQCPPRLVFGVAAFLFLACAVRARNQVGFWENDRMLFGHALSVTKNNYVASIDLGYSYSKAGNTQAALKLYHSALELAPGDPTAMYDLGNTLARYHDWNGAITGYRGALQLAPDQPDILNNLGFALAQNHQPAEAADCFHAVLKLKPDFYDALINLATMDVALRRYDDAAKQYEAALQLKPNNVQLMVYLGDALTLSGQKAAAAEHYRQALQLQPGNPTIRARLQALGRQNAD